MDKVITYLNTFKDEYQQSGNEYIPVEYVMSEVCEIAIKNWMYRPDKKPDLTEEQIDKAITKALAKTYYNN